MVAFLARSSTEVGIQPFGSTVSAYGTLVASFLALFIGVRPSPTIVAPTLAYGALELTSCTGSAAVFPFLTLIEAFFTVFALTLSGLVRILPGSTVLAFLLLVAVLELPCAAIIAAALPRAWLDRPCKTRRAAALSICALELPFSAIRTPGIAIPGRFLSR